MEKQTGDDSIVLGLEYSAGMEDQCSGNAEDASQPRSEGTSGQTSPNEAVPKLRTDSARVEVSSR